MGHTCPTTKVLQDRQFWICWFADFFWWSLARLAVLDLLICWFFLMETSKVNIWSYVFFYGLFQTLFTKLTVTKISTCLTICHFICKTKDTKIVPKLLNFCHELTLQMIDNKNVSSDEFMKDVEECINTHNSHSFVTTPHISNILMTKLGIWCKTEVPAVQV